ncbi:MAG: hypothetical protein KJZ86_13410 [Caldilineaceae bacterium]|nr:hypothetical protein [Caldilineaceae bacterium]HRJ45148.1 molybdopterin-binding protein [Caldilineaceae bacterium]
MIRCGLLLVTTEDGAVSDELSGEIRLLLRRALPSLVFVREQSVGSDRHLISELLRRWCDEDEMELVLTIGGTFPASGHSNEQITPEATADVIERAMPSLPEAMRIYAVEENPSALLDRGVAGIRARTLLLNLPGEEGLAVLFLGSVVDLLSPILDRLRPVSEEATAPADQDKSLSPKRIGLNAQEFTDFLASRQGK